MSPSKNPSKKKIAKLPLPVDILLNTGKNLGGGFVEYIKEVLPSSFSIYEESKASINEISKSFRNTSSQVALTVKSLFRLETFKTIGRWYMNKEDDFGLGDLDDSLDFDVGSDFSEDEYQSFISSVEENRDKELQKASDKISETVVETSHKLMETQVASLASITNSMEKTVSVVTTGFETINKTLQQILDVVSKNSSAILEFSSLMTGKRSDEYNSRSDDKFDFKSFLRNFSFENYFKLVKSNFNNNLGELSPFLSIFQQVLSTDPSMLLNAVGGPQRIHALFKSGLSGLANVMLPGLNDTFKKLDAAINKEITRGLLSLGNMQDDSSPIVGFLAKVFGVTGDFRNKAGFKTPYFKQEAIPFDTKTKEYITNAIPEYLRTITAAITGRDLVYDINRRALREKSKVVNEQRARIYSAATDHLRSVFDYDDFRNVGIDDKFNRDDGFYKRYLNTILNYLMNLAESNGGDFANNKLLVSLKTATNDDSIFRAIFDFIAPKDDNLKKELLNLSKEDKNKIVAIGKIIQYNSSNSSQVYQLKRKLISAGAAKNENFKYVFDDIVEQYPELVEDIKKGISDKIYKNAVNTNIIVESILKQIEDIKYDRTKSDEQKKSEKEKLENEIIEIAKKYKEQLNPEDPNRLANINLFVGDKEFTTDKLSLLPDKDKINFSINAEVHTEDIINAINENTNKIVNILTGIKVVSDKTIEATVKDASDISTTNNLLSNIDKTITNIDKAYNKNHKIIFDLLNVKFDSIIENFKRGVVTIDSGKIVDQSSSDAGKIGTTIKPVVDKTTGEVKNDEEKMPLESKPTNGQEDSLVTGFENASKSSPNKNKADDSEASLNSGNAADKQDIRPINEIQEEKIEEAKKLIGNSGNVFSKAIKLIIDKKPNEAVGTLVGHGSELGRNILDILNPEFKSIWNNTKAIFNGGKRNDRVFDNEGKEIGYKTHEVKGVFPLVGNWLKTKFDKLFNKSDKKAIEASEAVFDEAIEASEAVLDEAANKNQPGAAISDKKKLDISKIRRSITNAFIGATGGGILGGPIGLLLGTIAGGAASFVNLDSKISDFLFGDFFNQSVKTKDRKRGFIEKEIHGWLIPWQYQFKKFQETMIYDFEKHIVPAWKSISLSFSKLLETHFFRNFITYIKDSPIWKKFLKPIGEGLLKVGKKLLLGLDNLAKGLLPNLFGVLVTGGAHATATAGGTLINKVAEWISNLTGTRQEHDNIVQNARNKAEEFKKSSKTLGGGLFNTGLFSPKERMYLQYLEDKYTNTFDSLRDAIIGEDNPAVTYYNKTETTVNNIAENVEKIVENTSKNTSSETKGNTSSGTNSGSNAATIAMIAAGDSSASSKVDEAAGKAAEAAIDNRPDDAKKHSKEATKEYQQSKRDERAQNSATINAGSQDGGNIFSGMFKGVEQLAKSPLLPWVLKIGGIGLAIYLGMRGILSLKDPSQIWKALLKLLGIPVDEFSSGAGNSGGNETSNKPNSLDVPNPFDAAANTVGLDNLGAAMWNPVAPIRYKGTNIVANNMSNAIHTSEKLYAINGIINANIRNAIDNSSYGRAYRIFNNKELSKRISEAEENLNLTSETKRKLQSEIDSVGGEQGVKNLKNKRAELDKEINNFEKSNRNVNLSETEKKHFEYELESRRKELNEIDSKIKESQDIIKKNKSGLAHVEKQERKLLNEQTKLLTRQNNLAELGGANATAGEAYKSAAKAKLAVGKFALKAGIGATAGGMITRGAADALYPDINREDYDTDEEYSKAVEQRESALDTAQGTGAAVGGATAAFKPTPKLVTTIIKIISENLDKLKQLISAKWPKAAEPISALFKNIISKITPKSLSKIAKTQGAKLSKILTKFGVNTLGAPAVAITAAVAGVASAAYSTEWMFGVMPKDVDVIMRGISGALGAVFDGTSAGILELVDLVIDPIFHVGIRQLIARAIYKVLEDPTNTLEDKQNRLKAQKDAYNKKYGKNLTDAQFNDMVNPRALSSMWTGKTKLDENGNFMYDENGNVMKTGGFKGALGFGVNASYAKDTSGNVIRDKNGRAITNIDQYGNELKDDHGFGKVVSGAWRGMGAWFVGSKHNYATDKNGNAIFARNADGSIKYDENGNPVYIDKGPSKGILREWIIEPITYGFSETGKMIGGILNKISEFIKWAWNGFKNFVIKTIPDWWRNTKIWAHRGINNLMLHGKQFFTNLFTNISDRLSDLGIAILKPLSMIPGVKQLTENLEKKKRINAELRDSEEKYVLNHTEEYQREGDLYEAAVRKTDMSKDSKTREDFRTLAALSAGGGVKFTYSIGGNKRKTDITTDDFYNKSNKFVNAKEYMQLRNKGFSPDQIMLLPYGELKSAIEHGYNGEKYKIYKNNEEIPYHNDDDENSPEVDKLVERVKQNDKKAAEANGPNASINVGDVGGGEIGSRSDMATMIVVGDYIAKRYAAQGHIPRDINHSKKQKPQTSNSTSNLSTPNKVKETTPSETKSVNINNYNGKYKYPCNRIPGVNAPFGQWRSREDGSSYRHSGVDLDLRNEPLLACCDGDIIYIQHDPKGYGHYIIQSSPDNKYGILYGHLKEGSIRCKEGQHVTQGTVLATTGSTGRSTGPHLHLEFRGFKNGSMITKGNFFNATPMDPLSFINGDNTATENADEFGTNKNGTAGSNGFSLGLLSLIPGFDILNQGMSNGLSSLLGLLGFVSSPTTSPTTSDSTPYNGTYTPYNGTYTPVSNGTTEQNRKSIYTFLRTKGLSPAGASAVVGNLFAESSLNPTIENGIGAYGIAQWLDDRKIALKRSQPNNYNTLDGQLQFLYKELNSYPDLLNALKATGGNTAKLTERFCREFERPSESEIRQSLPTRTSYANETLNKNWGGPEPIELKDMNSMFSNIKSTNIDIPNPVDSLINVLNNILNELKQIKGINSTNTNIMGGMATGSIRQKEQVKTLLNRINNFTSSHTPVSQQFNSNIINFVKGI